MRRELAGAVRGIARHERLVAAALAGAAVLAGLHALRPSGGPQILVVTAAHALAPGTVLDASDLTQTRLPRASLPDGAVTDLGAAVGQTVSGPLARGEVIAQTRLVGSALLRSLPPGTVATPVRIADAGAAALVRDGDRIDLLAVPAEGGPSTRVAGDVLVIASGSTGSGQPGSGASGSGAPSSGALGEGALGDGALIVVAASPSVAAALASAAVSSRISLVLRAG